MGGRPGGRVAVEMTGTNAATGVEVRLRELRVGLLVGVVPNGGPAGSEMARNCIVIWCLKGEETGGEKGLGDGGGVVRGALGNGLEQAKFDGVLQIISVIQELVLVMEGTAMGRAHPIIDEGGPAVGRGDPAPWRDGEVGRL